MSSSSGQKWKHKNGGSKTSVQQLLKSQNNILNEYYVNRHLAQFDFQSKPLDGFHFQARLIQTVLRAQPGGVSHFPGNSVPVGGNGSINNNNTNNNASVAANNSQNYQLLVNNMGFAGLFYSRSGYHFQQEFDTYGNFDLYLQYTLTQKYLHDWDVFGRFRSLHSAQGSALSGSSDQRSLGMSRNFAQGGAKCKLNFDSSTFQLLGSIFSDDTALKNLLPTNYQYNSKGVTDKFNYGAVLGAAYNYRAQSFSLYKSVLWYQDREKGFNVVARSADKKTKLFTNIAYSLHQRLNNQLHIALNFQHDLRRSINSSYKFEIGARIKNWNRVECRLKLNERLRLSISTKIDLNDNSEIIISNDLDLGVQATTPNNSNLFPLGFKLVLNE